MRPTDIRHLGPLLLIYLFTGSRCQNLSYVEILWEHALSPSVLPAACSSAISALNRRLLANSSLPEERELYEDCFGSGRRTELVTDDRFLHRMLRCFKLAGETHYSESEYTVHYCYGYNLENQDSAAYSVCIPSPCSEDNATLLENWRSVVAGSADEEAITETKCVRSRHEVEWYRKPLPVLSLLYILLCLLTVSLATVYHYQRNGQSNSVLRQTFLAFSAKKNLPPLYEAAPRQRSSITCMYGIRSLTILWIIIGHSFAWVTPYIENIEEFKHDIADNFFNQWISNFLLTVDVFLVLGGTVNAYGWFCKVDKMEVKPSWSSFGYWLRFYRHRVVRLWPALFYTLVGVIFLSNLHYHAMWPEHDPAVQCPRYWWQNLLFISSLFDNHCMGWTWYISTEFIYYLLSPIFLLTLHKSKVFGFTVGCTVIALSSALRAHAMVAYNLPPTQLGWNSPPIFNSNFMQHFSAMYIKPQYRIGPYTVGLLLGYILSHTKKCFPKQYTGRVRIGWTISTLLGLSAVFGLYPVLRGWSWPIYYVLYGSVHRVVFALSVAWLIYACHTGSGGIVNGFLSHKFFYPFAALSYSVYLSHMPVLFGSFLQMPFPYHYTGKLPVFLQCIVRLIFSYILGLQCSLLSEIPAVNVERILLTRNKKGRDRAEVQELSKAPSRETRDPNRAEEKQAPIREN